MAKIICTWLVTSFLLFASANYIFTDDMSVVNQNKEFDKKSYNSTEKNNIKSTKVLLISN